MQPIILQHIRTIYWIGLHIGIGALRDNYAHRKIMENLLGSAGVHRCPGLSYSCTLGLANQQVGKYISANELEFNRFCPFPLGELLWYFRTQVNNINLAA